MNKITAKAILHLVSLGFTVKGPDPVQTVSTPTEPTPAPQPAPKVADSGLASRIAPHGYGPDGEPLAPYGFTKDGRPKKSKGGRPAGSKNKPKAAAPVAPKAPTPVQPTPAPVTGGFSLDLSSLVESAPTPAPATPTPTTAQALAQLEAEMGLLD